MNFSLQWFGAEAIGAVRAAARKAERDEADVLAKDTAGRAPVGGPEDPTAGRLRASWHVEEKTGHAAVVSDDPVAIYQEFGTSNMPAQPSLGPAVHAAERRWGERLKAYLEAAIRF